MRHWSVLFCIAVTCSACVRATTAITVRADGSGTIEQVVGATPQAMAMIQSFSAGREGGPGSGPGMFSEAEAKKAAAQMGVRFVSGEPIKTAELEGYKAHYAFDDIAKLKMNMQQAAETAAPTAGDRTSEPPFGFGFERRGASSVVTIQMPDKAPGGKSIMGLPEMPGGGGADAQENAQALAMMKMMMKGLYIDISLAVDGRITKTNAPYVEGSRVTLVQVDFDKLLADEAGFLKLQQASDLKTLKDVPGMKIVADPKVTVEFGR
jgi:hypothetical protein